MKIISLVVILSFIHCCLGASNRTTVWFMSSNQIYSSNKQFEACSLSGTLANPANPPTASSVTLLTTSKLTISGTLVALESNTANTFISGTALLGSISIVFNYNSSHYLTLSLNTPGTSLVTSLTSILSTSVTNALLVATPTTFPIVITNNQVLSPIGTKWLQFTYIQELSITVPNAGPTGASGILITDFLTSTTIAILQTSDAGASTNVNAFYQIAIRTETSSITGSNLLTVGCGASGRKRSVDHMLQKRYLSTCPTTGVDPSLTSTTISSLCSNAAALYQANGGATPTTKSDTQLTDAVIRAVNGINSLYISDIGYFSAASSQFSNGVFKFGTMIAMASFFLNSIY